MSEFQSAPDAEVAITTNNEKEKQDEVSLKRLKPQTEKVPLYKSDIL